MLRPATPATCVLGPSLLISSYSIFVILAIIELAIIITKTDYELS